VKLAGLDIAVLVAYFVAMIVTGLYFSRKNQSTEEYFVGGRAFSGWIIGLSLVGTSISSATFLAFPADAFRTNWIRFVPNLMLIPVVFIAAAVFLPFFRRGKVTSAYEYLEARFGPTVRVYAAFTFIIAQLFRVSMVLYLVSLVIQQITGFAPVTCILISGGIVAFYAVVGGIDAVIWTDVVQTVVLAVGAVIMLVVIVQGVPGGIGEIVATGWQQGKFGLGDVVDGASQPTQWGLSLSDKTVTMLLLVGLTIFLTEYCANQNVVQRYCAARSTGEARKAMFVCAFTSVPMWAFFMFLGTAMYVFFQVNEHPQVNEMLAPGGTAEHLIPLFIIEYLPAGATGLVIAAALAAAMSSIGWRRSPFSM
jgi:SSS family solute:Na+ symporter